MEKGVSLKQSSRCSYGEKDKVSGHSDWKGNREVGSR